jgi:glycerophosphoryl diester phosphodiesterase
MPSPRTLDPARRRQNRRSLNRQGLNRQGLNRQGQPREGLGRSGAPGAVALLVMVLALIGSALICSALSAGPAAAEPTDDAGSPAPYNPSARLLARATLSADFIAPGPPSGSKATPANGRRGPFPGQVIPGFSAAVANGDGTYWAMPDNGFGTKANSTDFLLRIYLVKPRWERANGGPGRIKILRSVTLSDPRHKIEFPIVNETTTTRPLTGADFDIESLQRDSDGSFWIGDEFGPFILHADGAGRMLAAPVASPLGKSPQNPGLDGETPNVQPSGGFEAMAQSANKRYLYPIVEKALFDDSDPRRRIISEFDTRTNRYTGRTWAYRVDTDANLVADAQLTAPNTLSVLERDDLDGASAVTKRVYRVKLGRADSSGQLAKSLTVDLLGIANPDHLGDGAVWGTGDPFSFGYQSVETLVPLSRGRLLIANDNNYPGDAARNPGTPDDTEMIIIKPEVGADSHTAELIGHRGASGYRPEHTLASYELAIRMCADVIEPDVVATKDHVLVVRHENDISGTTDVATHQEFAGRKTTKTIDGRAVTGWFTEDFTLAELRTLRAIERLPKLRPDNTAFNGKYPIPTLEEVLDLARHSRSCTGQQVGVAPETKHPTYFASVGLPLEQPLVDALNKAGLTKKSSPVVVQSFETGNLQRLNTMTDVQLIQLIDCSGAPWDLKAAGDERTYADLSTEAGLKGIARYADAVGFCKDVMIPRDSVGRLLTPTAAIADAHAVRLQVIGWTFRRENNYLPLQYRSSADLTQPGDLPGEIRSFLDAGMDGFFTDNPDIGAAVVTRP